MVLPVKCGAVQRPGDAALPASTEGRDELSRYVDHGKPTGLVLSPPPDDALELDCHASAWHREPAADRLRGGGEIWYAERPWAWQGGSVQPEPASSLEIACDESGYEGEKLVGGTTVVFAHAGVRLDLETTERCIQELRDRIRSPATEYKANHVLRTKNREALLWLLGPSGPLHRNAQVYLIDKAFFLVRKVIDLLVDDAGHAMAVTLYRDGQKAFGRELWDGFLASCNDLMRAKDHLDVTTTVDSFFRMVDVLHLADPPSQVDDILGLLGGTRPRATALRARLVADPTMIPVLDPLVPAIIRAVDHWGVGRQPVSIVHDRQNTLSVERVEQLMEILGDRLTSLRFVGSALDSRVQVADFLAGVARKIATDQLDDRDDTELTQLLQPYVDSSSIWGDDRSWSRLMPAARA